MSKKRKLPSYTLKEALEKVDPCNPDYYTLKRIKTWFPGRRKITVRDVLKTSLNRFSHGDFSSEMNKEYAVDSLVPSSMGTKLNTWKWLHSWGCSSSTLRKYLNEALKLCDAYERGELD